MCISVVSGLDAIGSEHQRTKILNFTGIKVSILSFLSRQRTKTSATGMTMTRFLTKITTINDWGRGGGLVLTSVHTNSAFEFRYRFLPAPANNMLGLKQAHYCRRIFQHITLIKRRTDVALFCIRYCIFFSSKNPNETKQKLCFNNSEKHLIVKVRQDILSWRPFNGPTCWKIEFYELLYLGERGPISRDFHV